LVGSVWFDPAPLAGRPHDAQGVSVTEQGRLSWGVERGECAGAGLLKRWPTNARVQSRVLARVLPVLFESADNVDDFAEQVLWNGRIPAGYLSDDEVVRVGLDPSGQVPYGPSDLDDEPPSEDEKERRALELQRAVVESSAVPSGSSSSGGEAKSSPSSASVDTATAQEEDSAPAAASSGSKVPSREVGEGVELTEGSSERSHEEEAAVTTEDQASPPEEAEMPGTEEGEDSEAEAEQEGDPTVHVRRTMKRIAKGELPPGFRRAQPLADLSEPPPQLLWVDAPPLDIGLEGEPLGSILSHSLMSLMFAPGLTVEEQGFAFYMNKRRVLKDKKESKVLNENNAIWPTILWAGGVGYPAIKPSASAAMVEARVELLRLLVSLGSAPLFRTPLPEHQPENRFLDQLTNRSCPFTPNLILSLFNTVLAFDPVGFNAYIPYASTVLSDGHEALVDASLQALLILLDHCPGAVPRVEIAALPPDSHHAVPTAPSDPFGYAPSADEARPAPAVGEEEEEEEAEAGPRAAATEEGPTARVGVPRAILASIRTERDLELISTRFARLLNAVWQSDASYFPGASASPVLCQQELVSLLWHLLNDNASFLNHVLSKGHTNSLVVPLVYFLWSGRLNPARAQFCQLCTFVLFLLSGYRDFAVALNEPVTASLPGGILIDVGVTTHADLLVAVLHKLVVNAHRRLRPLYGHFLSTLSNVSPYIFRLSLASAVKLGSLLDVLSAPRFLFARPDNFPLLSHLILTFANLIQYQFRGNEEAMYALVQNEERIEWLASVTHEAALSAHSEAVQHAKRIRERETGEAPPTAALEAAAASESMQPQERASSPGASPSLADGAMDSVWSSWEPTKEWFLDQTRDLPHLFTVTLAIRHMSAILRSKCAKFAEEGTTPDDEMLIGILKRVTLVGVIPRPHSILSRRHVHNQATWQWLSAFVWGTIYLRGVDQLHLFDASHIQLFQLQIV
jgi:hypothetical protein